MVAISGKVTASTSAATVSTVVVGILAAHFWKSAPADVTILVETLITAGVTFGAGFMAKHGIAYESAVADAAAVAGDLGVQLPADVQDVVQAVAPTTSVPAAPGGDAAPVVAEPVAVAPAPETPAV